MPAIDDGRPVARRRRPRRSPTAARRSTTTTWPRSSTCCAATDHAGAGGARVRGGARGGVPAPRMRWRSRAARRRCTAPPSPPGSAPGDEVVTTPITFAASANCALYVGARPRFVDIDPRDLEPRAPAVAAAAAGARTRAVVPVRYAGLPVDLGACGPRSAPRCVVIEDGCARARRPRAARWSASARHADMTAFSFHPVKAMTTGEGGAVTTERRRAGARACGYSAPTASTRERGSRRARPTGARGTTRCRSSASTTGSRTSSARSASPAERLDGWVARRNAVARATASCWRSTSAVELPPAAAPAARCTAYHLFVVRHARRRGGAARRLRRRCARAGIGVQVHYIPVYRHALLPRRARLPAGRVPARRALLRGADLAADVPGADRATT